MRLGEINTNVDVTTNVMVTLLSANLMNIDLKKGNTHKWTATQNQTIATVGQHIAGQEFVFLITNDGNGARTISFGPIFKTKGNLVGTSGKTALIKFVSDGTNLYELTRNTGL